MFQLLCNVSFANSDTVRQPLKVLTSSLANYRYDNARQALLELQTHHPPVQGSLLPYAQLVVDAADGHCWQATSNLKALTHSAWRAKAVTALMGCWWKQGHRDRARALLETHAPSLTAKSRCSVYWSLARLAHNAGLVQEAGSLYHQARVACPVRQVATQAQAAIAELQSYTRMRVPSLTSDELIAEAQQWTRRGRYQKAVHVLRRAVIVSSRVKDAHVAEDRARVALAKAYLTIGGYQQAENAVSAALMAQPYNRASVVELLFVLAEIYARTARVDAALATLQNILTHPQVGDNADRARVECARLANSAGLHSMAQKMLAHFVNTSVDDIDMRAEHRDLRERALWQNAWSQWQENGLIRASAAIAALMQLPPQQSKSLYWLGRWHLDIDDRQNALAYFDQTCSDPSGYYCLAAQTIAAQVIATGIDARDNPDKNIVDDDRHPCTALLRHMDATDDDKRLTLLDVNPAATWLETSNADILSAQQLLALGLKAEALAYISPIEYRDLDAKARMALAQVLLLADQVYRSSIVVRGAIAQSLGLFCAHNALQTSDLPHFAPITQQSAIAMRVAFPAPYQSVLEPVAKAKKVPASVLASIIFQESAFDEKARSSRNARGLMQMLPTTGRSMARLENLRGFSAWRLYQADVSITLGGRYIAELWRRYQGEPSLVIAAYHAGERNVDRWLIERGHLSRDVFIEEIPFNNTRSYVKASLASIARYALLYYPHERNWSRGDERYPDAVLTRAVSKSK